MHLSFWGGGGGGSKRVLDFPLNYIDWQGGIALWWAKRNSTVFLRPPSYIFFFFFFFFVLHVGMDLEASMTVH